MVSYSLLNRPTARCVVACCAVWLALTHVTAATEPPITDVAFAPGASSVVAVSQAGVHVVGWPDLNRQRTIHTHFANLHSIAFSPDGSLVAVGGGNPAEDGSVLILAWPSLEPVARFAPHTDSVKDLAFRDATSLLSASLDRSVALLDVKTRKPLGGFSGHSRGVSAVSLMPDQGKFVSTGIDQSLRVWDLESGKVIRSLNQHTGSVHALALRPSEGGLPMVASASGDRTIRFWQPTIGRMVRYIRLDAEPRDIAWMPDGTHIAAACIDGQVRLVNADDVTLREARHAIDGWAYAIAAHPTDGSVVACGANGALRILEFTLPPDK